MGPVAERGPESADGASGGAVAGAGPGEGRGVLWLYACRDDR
jgi:hypothetical protein